MKYFFPLVIMLFILQSCMLEQYPYIERAEIVGRNRINVYFSGNTTLLIIPRGDIWIFLNGNMVGITAHNHTRRHDNNVNGLRRYRLTINRNIYYGDTVVVVGHMNRNIFGSAAIQHQEN